MKKNILTEINNIRRIMGLHLIMEDTKTEIYSLLKKLSSESTSETEKNEIKAILKRANVTDEEIQRLLRGGEQTLTQLTRKIEGNLTVELSDDLEKILIKSGVASEVFRELGEGSGARLIDSVESLYTAMKNGQITMEDYLLRKDTMLDRFDEFFSREEMQRALKSMESDVDIKIENARRATEDIVLDIEDDISIEDIRVNDPSLESFEIPTSPIENPDDILLQIFSPNAVKKVKKEFKNYTQKEIRDQFDKWKADKSLSKIQVEKWDKFMENIDKNWWGKLSNKTKVLFIVAVLYGPNVVYLMAKLGVPSDALILIPFVGPLLKPSEEEKEIIKTQEELSDYVQKVSNYGVYDKKDNKFVVDLETLIESEGTVDNRLKSKVVAAIRDYYDLNKSNLNSGFIYEFMNKTSTEKIQPLIDNVKELKDKFTVKGLEDKDPNRPKDLGRKISDSVTQFKEKFNSMKGTLKLNPEAEKKQKTSYEQPKQKTIYPSNF
jgi:5-bromo-4-chloroindolyl phosphate hydrolysis protein